MTALDDAITAAQTLIESEYTTASWADLETALAVAIGTKNNRFATTPVIEASTAALTDAVDELVPETVATPTATPVAGAKDNAISVALACATDGADIYYTIDGTTPDETKTKYTTPIALATAATIKAIAVKGAMNDSSVLSAAYTFKAASPVAAPAAGEVANPTNVALTTETDGADIYYTIDGTVPSASKTKYTAPIEVTVPVTIKAITIKTGFTNSDILTAVYTIAS